MTIQSAMLDMTMVFADFLRSRRRNLLSAQDLGALEEAVADLRTLPARKTFISRDQNVKEKGNSLRCMWLAILSTSMATRWVILIMTSRH
jgi:hypothetical protein